jgi:hypothetical protein
MAMVTVTVTSSATTDTPTGVVPAGYQYEIQDNTTLAVIQTDVSTDLSAYTFPEDVPAGTYLVTVNPYDSVSEHTFGSGISGTLTVPAPATYQAPTAITIALS